MANPNKDSAPAEKAPVADPKVQLNEFCARLSENIVRPELIGAFAYSMRAAKVWADTEAGFKARWDEFINKPV